MAIAAGDVPARHWFRLGREVTPIGRGAALISWSGSMFEYLMPSLVMRAPLGSLIEKTNELVVRRQIDYADGLGVPWGISESAYNARDKELTYQYSNFGVPGLGFKRGLSENLVIAPYATALATMVDPAAAAANFNRLAAIGGRGRYGFYEALDFTPSRLPEGQAVAIVRAYMAHHQGMTVVAIANALLDGVMRTRFHAEPIVQATELLLQERTPRDVAVAHPRAEEVGASATVDDLEPAVVRRLHNPHAASPSAHLLSNGRYSVMLTAAGSGYSRWGEHAVTRWREDTTRDDWGSYVFLRDVESGEVWSATYQPRGTRPDGYDVMFAEDRAEFVRHDGAFTTTARRRRLARRTTPRSAACRSPTRGDEARDIEITSYAEIVLATPLADAAHQVFSKLFVQTEYPAVAGAILATRRRREPGEPELWAAHLAVVEGEAIGEVEIETDRARFLGRGNDIGNADRGDRRSAPVEHRRAPCSTRYSRLRRRLRIPAGGTARIAFWTVVASSREALLDAIDKHQDTNAFERAATLAWTQAQVQLRYLDIASAEASLYQRLAGHVLYANPALRSSSDTIRRGLAGQPVLVGAGHIGRHADRAGAHRRGRGCRRRPRAAARPRVLAPEGPGRRSRDPERARRLLRPGPADRPGDAGPHQPVDDPSRDRARAGRHLRPAQRPDLRRDPRPAAGRRARRPAEPPRQPGRSAQSRPDAAWRAAACPAQARDRCRSQGNAAAGRGPGARCSSSTASGASRPTAGNM